MEIGPYKLSEWLVFQGTYDPVRTLQQSAGCPVTGRVPHEWQSVDKAQEAADKETPPPNHGQNY